MIHLFTTLKMKHWSWLWMLFLAANARADVVGHHEGAQALLLSGDGKTAFSSGDNGTRVWDVEGKREMAALPVQAGSVLAVAEDGRRVLCRRIERKTKQELFDYSLWRRHGDVWQRGTQVRSATIQPLLDATFVGREVVLLWEQSIEQRGASGRLQRTTRLKELSKWPYEGKVPLGALSADGTRAVASGDDLRGHLHAFIYDVLGGRPLMRIKLNPFDWYTTWEFSPNAEVLGAVVGKPVGPWNDDDGPQPVQMTRSLWNVRTGDELGDSFDLSLTFWPKGRRGVLVQTTSDAPSQLELFDVSTEKTSPLPFPQPWKGQVLKMSRLSRDGKVLAVLDSKGDIWVERESENLHARWLNVAQGSPVGQERGFLKEAVDFKAHKRPINTLP